MLRISCGEPSGQQRAFTTLGHLSNCKQSPNSWAQPLQPIATCYAEYFIRNDKIFFLLPPSQPRFHICSLDNLSLPHHCHAGCPWNLTSVAFCAQWSFRPCLTPTISDRRHADLNSESWHLRHTGITQVNQGIPCCLPANNRGKNMTSWTTDLTFAYSKDSSCFYKEMGKIVSPCSERANHTYKK